MPGSLSSTVKLSSTSSLEFTDFYIFLSGHVHPACHTQGAFLIFDVESPPPRSFHRHVHVTELSVIRLSVY